MDTSNKKNATFMKLFQDLSDHKDGIRLRAGESLIMYLLKEQETFLETNNQANWCENVKYSIGRLFQGLCSGNKAARLGFATTCTALLKSLKIESESQIQLLTKIFNEKVQIVSDSGKKKDDKDILLGQVFFYLCIIRGTNFQQNSEQINMIYSSLLNLSRKKSYLRAPCFEGITQLVQNVSKENFEREVWPKLSNILSVGWENCHPELLELLVTCHKEFSHSCGVSFLKCNQWIPNKKGKNIIGEHSFKFLGKILSTASMVHPKLHRIVDYIIREVSKLETGLIVKFWKESVESSLLTTTAEKKYLALQIAVILIPFLDANHVKAVWSNNIIMSLFYALSNKGNPIHILCKKFLLEKLEKSLKNENTSAEIQIEFLFRLFSMPLGVELDNLTSTAYISTTVRCLKIKAALQYKSWLEKFFITGKPGIPGVKLAELFKARKWCCTQLSTIAKMYEFRNESKLTVEICKFLLFHASFKLTNSKFSVTGLDLDKDLDFLPLSDSTKKVVTQNFYKSFAEICSRKFTGKSGCKDEAKSVEMFLHELIEFASILLNSSDVELLSHTDSHILDEWKLMLRDVKFLQEVTKGNAEVVIAATMLLMYNGLSLLCGTKTERNDAKESSEELRILIGSHFGCTKDDETLEMVSPIVEILLSMLARTSYSNRIIVNQVFKLISPILSKDSLFLILDSIDPKSSLVEDNDDNLDDEFSETSDDHDAAFSETDEDIDDEFKEKIQAALGPAAIPIDSANVDGDEEGKSSDSIVEDLSDDAMMRLDPILAEVFRQRNKNNERDEGQITFKLRCLDLIEILTSWKQKHNNDKSQNLVGSPVVVYGICSLYNFMEQYLKQDKYKTLADKLKNLIKTVCKMRLFSNLPDAELENIHEDIEHLLTKACAANSQYLCKLASNCAIVLVKQILSPKESVEANVNTIKEDENVKKVITLYKNLLNKFMMKQDSHILPEIFNDFLERFPAFSVFLLSDLAQYIANGKRAYRKMHACIMAHDILKRNVQKIKDLDVTSVLYNTVLKVINESVENPDKLKPKYMAEVFKVLNVVTKIIPVQEDKNNGVVMLNKFKNLPAVQNNPTLINLTYNALSKFGKEPEKADFHKHRKEKKTKRKQRLNDKNKSISDEATEYKQTQNMPGIKPNKTESKTTDLATNIKKSKKKRKRTITSLDTSGLKKKQELKQYV